ncbi:MAG: hypothetical protein ACOY0T_16965 [Myxococcota bacterium]
MAAERSPRADWLPRLGLFGCVAAAYVTALGGPFQFDDHGVIVRETSVHDLGAFFGAASASLRPLLKLSYALCWALSPASWPFHLFNLLIHLVNVELVLRLYSAAFEPKLSWPFGSRAPGGSLAALLFALHPLQTEAITYISGRSASLATSFALVALLFHAAGARSGRTLFSAVLTPLAFVAAVLTKETTAILALAFVAWDLIIERRSFRQAAWRFLPWVLLGIALLGLAIMQGRYFALLYSALGQRALGDSLRYQLSGVAYLVKRLLFLEPLCIDPALQLVAPPGTLVAVAAASMGAVCLLAARFARRWPLLAFGVFWFVLHTFVPYVLVPRADVINERHAYLANAGLFIGLASLWCEVRPRVREPWQFALWVALTLGLGALTLRRNRDYRSEIALWQSTVRAAPHNPRAFNNLGVAFESSHRYAEARNAYARALVLEPRYATARKNLERSMRQPLR